MSETAWLIERADGPSSDPMYLGGDGWTREHLRAVRFKTREDGERFATWAGLGPVWITEHGWEASR